MQLLSVTGAKWAALPSHRLWLLEQANSLLGFFERAAIDPSGGFFHLGDDGAPLPQATHNGRGLHATTRMVHCFSIAHLMGRPGAAAMIDHGMDYIWNGHRDPDNGGYFWTMGPDGPVDSTKQAYGHAFVLLAASSAKMAGHPDADRLLGDVSEIIAGRFWEESHGAAAEQFTADWQAYDDYRGQNANMHLTEALMSAFEATADETYLRAAERIADLIVGRHAAANGWRLPEHFDSNWQIDPSYSGNKTFRPYGTTPGHWLEWARLLLQLWELGGRALDWLPQAAHALFENAVTEGWDADSGGFYYTLDWDGSPHIANRYFWPCCEGIGAAAFLNAIDGSDFYEDWYRRIWNFAAQRFIDRKHGGWFPQLNEQLQPARALNLGKPDLYHALQACLIPLLPTTGSITSGLLDPGIRL